MKYIAAATLRVHPYPAYINVSRHSEHNGVRISMRPAANGDDGSCSAQVFIDLNADEYASLLAEMTAEQRSGGENG